MTSYPLRSARIGTRLAACFVMIVVAMLVADVVAVWHFRMTAAPAEQLAKADRIFPSRRGASHSRFWAAVP